MRQEARVAERRMKPRQWAPLDGSAVAPRRQAVPSPIRGLKSTATFIDRSAVTAASIIPIIVKATWNNPLQRHSLSPSPKWQAQDGAGAAGIGAVFHMDAAAVERGGFADEAEAEAGAFAAGTGARE